MKSSNMIWGYRGEAYRTYGITIPLKWGISTHPHGLITGSSGSGKSQALLFLMGKLIQADYNIVPYICDFKKSETFRFLKSYPYYYAGQDCYRGIMEYYQMFSEIRESESNAKRHILICDEYPSLINYLQMKDKQDKTKLANDILSAISEILMLGRGTGSGFAVWIVTQRADSTLFANGARDNFMVIVALGKLSKEQKGMIFPGEEIEPRICQAGEGVILADGSKIEEVKYPLIADIADWQNHILQILLRNGGACANREAGGTGSITQSNGTEKTL